MSEFVEYDSIVSSNYAENEKAPQCVRVEPVSVVTHPEIVAIWQTFSMFAILPNGILGNATNAS